MPDLNPSDISRKTFVITRKGFDAQQVRAYLEELAASAALLTQELADLKKRNETLEAEVASTKAAEEALQMTLVTATKAKDEMLAEAKEQAEELRHEAFQEAQRARSEAIRESDDLVARSREESLQVIEEAQRSAQMVITAAQAEGRELRDKVVHLRQALAASRAALEETLEATLETIADADGLLELADLSGSLDDDPIVIPDQDDGVDDVPAEPVGDPAGAAVDSGVVSEAPADFALVDAMVGEAPPVELEFEAASVPTADQLLAQLRSITD